ncbi:M2 family metallopeptidase, partial [uncultured Sphingomonas sp.]|uniref:M2 family metallopeptidase n=1 Tax=uncultured Sphingomonas sp. TaxID=158754 RepID=UPI0035CA860F
MFRVTMSAAVLALALAAIPAAAKDVAPGAAGRPTAAEADAFVAGAEADYAARVGDWSRAAWVNATYITDDTDALAAKAGAEATELGVKYALGAARFNGVPGLSADTRRKLGLMKNGLTLPAPTRPGAATELATITTRMQSSYGKGKGTLDGKPINGSDIE